MFITEPIDSHICSKSLETTKEENVRDLFDESSSGTERQGFLYQTKRKDYQNRSSAELEVKTDNQISRKEEIKQDY